MAVNRLALGLLVVLLVSAQVLAAEILVQFKDPRGDDRGAGELVYPGHEVFVPGLFDLLRFRVSADGEFVYFDCEFAALTNPFRAPEGYFHQRLELYITTGIEPGWGQIQIGPHLLHTSPEAGWDLRLSAAPFGESRLYTAGGAVHEVAASVLPDGRTIRLQVPRSLLPDPSPAWGYYLLVGAFDGLAPGFWRDLGEGPWQVGGAGVPVFDLLAPCWGARSQRAQLSGGVLYPVYGGKSPVWSWLAGGAGVLIICCLLWRWLRGT